MIVSSTACSERSSLPSALSDDEFWHLSERLSEPAGIFDVSDNLVSNEPYFVENVRRLRRAGGVYVGVGPEQNFSYIARLRPAMAFIIDIRRENRDLHLLYKALFELSIDRADFVSRLFSRPRPQDLPPDASVDEIFRRYDAIAASAEQYNWNAALVREWLLKTRKLPLSANDLNSIDRAFKAFYTDGPAIHFWGSRPAHGLHPSYRELMTAKDGIGRHRSFLASEEEFTFVKDLQARNMIVPLIGDFGGPSALRGVGVYVRAHAAVVQAFYASNVAVYLSREQRRTFCANLASLPASSRSWVIESDGVRSYSAKLETCWPEAR